MEENRLKRFLGFALAWLFINGLFFICGGLLLYFHAEQETAGSIFFGVAICMLFEAMIILGSLCCCCDQY